VANIYLITFSRPYLSNGRAYGTVVVCSSSSVHHASSSVTSRLLLATNRKWHIGFQMTWKLMTLD